MTQIQKVLAKDTSFLKSIHKYVAGSDSLPYTDSNAAKLYKKKFESKLAKLQKSTFTLYRGFDWPEDLSEQDSFYIEAPDVIGAYTLPEDMLLSFSEDKNTALYIAKERAEESPFAFVIELSCPADRVWWHWKLDPVGLDHPKEKEVIIQPTGLKYKIIKKFTGEY